MKPPYRIEAPFTDPRPSEGESEYLERILGLPGSVQMRIGDPSAVEYYRNVWKAYQTKPQAAPCCGHQCERKPNDVGDP